MEAVFIKLYKSTINISCFESGCRKEKNTLKTAKMCAILGDGAITESVVHK